MRKGKMYNEASALYKMMVLEKSNVLDEILFEALESNGGQI